MRIYETWKASPSKRMAGIINYESKLGLYSTKALKMFAARMVTVEIDFLALLLRVKMEGVTIVGISSPARSNTLLGFAQINAHLVSYIVEKRGSPKIGLYTPGAHIPVLDEKVIFERQPECAIVLSWHIGEELMKLYRRLGFRGKFIMTLPVPRIVDDIQIFICFSRQQRGQIRESKAQLYDRGNDKCFCELENLSIRTTGQCGQEFRPWEGT